MSGLTASETRRPGWVRLAAVDVSLDRLRSHADRHLFEAARAGPGYGECLCTTPPQPLVIRLRAGRYHLAGWPYQGAQHAAWCPFFKFPGALAGQSGYAAGAITEMPDGTRIRLDQPLTVRVGEDTSAAGAAGGPAGALSRRAISLSGLLRWLWEQAGLNRWDHRPGRRGWPDVEAALRQAAAGCLVNGQPLDSCFYVPVPFTPDARDRADAALDRFVSALGDNRPGQRRRGLILGELRGASRTPYGERITLRHAKTPVFASAAVMDRARSAGREVFAGSRPGGSRQILLLLVHRTARGYLVAVDLCATLASRAYIPAENAYEVQMADHLVAHGRDFVKPSGPGPGIEVFPDFIVTDTGAELAYVEIWGVPGREDFEQRRRAEEGHYRRSGAVLVGWDVTATELADLAFPPRA